MKKLLGIVCAVFILSPTAKAIPLLEGEVGVGYVKLSPSGNIRYQGTSIDVENTLGLGDSKKVELRAELELPIPLLPNVRLEYLPVEMTGTKTLTQTIQFAGVTYTANTTVKSKLRLNQIDGTIYYNVPFLGLLTLGKARANAGVTIKYIDGYAQVKDSTGTIDESKSFKVPVPMLSAEVELRPVSGLSVVGEGKWIGYKGNEFLDARASARIYLLKALPIPVPSFIVDPFVGVGYRYERLKIDDIEDVYSDLKLKGLFFEGGARF